MAILRDPLKIQRNRTRDVRPLRFRHHLRLHIWMCKLHRAPWSIIRCRRFAVAAGAR